LLKQIEDRHGIEEDSTEEREQMTAEEAARRVKRIREKVQKEKLDKEGNRSLKKIEKEAIPRMERYRSQLDIMGERNSYSKTDPDATFMRMKEDAMLNGQLKPGYNVQISTENQFITHYDIFQRPADILTLIPFLESFEKRYGKQSEKVVADSGYGSEENYEYMLGKGIKPFVKYNMFHVEQRRKYTQNPYLASNLFYNKDKDYYVCPMGQHMELVRNEKRYTASGYEHGISIYRAMHCTDCPLHCMCHKSKYNRQIEVNHKLEEYKKTVRELLMSEEGLEHRSKRPVEPEAVFGQIKECGKFRRLRLRGINGAKIEFGLKAIAHNLGKMARTIAKNSIKSKFFADLYLFFALLCLYIDLKSIKMISICFSCKNKFLYTTTKAV